MTETTATMYPYYLKIDSHVLWAIISQYGDANGELRVRQPPSMPTHNVLSTRTDQATGDLILTISDGYQPSTHARASHRETSSNPQGSPRTCGHDDGGRG